MKTTVTYAPTAPSDGDTGSLTVTTSDGRSGTVVLTGSTVGATVDYALGAPTDESSVARGAGSHLAVDGDTDGVFADGSVTHTDADPYSWWTIDLGASRKLGRIVVWNRTDCCGDQLADYWVFLSDTPFDTTLTPAQQAARTGVDSVEETSAPDPSTAITVPPGTSGRYLMVQEGASRRHLDLAEVQVFGSA